jgi:D-alanine-D-alanine ligase
LGLLVYADEGQDCRFSATAIRELARKAGQVLVIRPGAPDGKVYVGRRGLRKYHLAVEGAPRRLGQGGKGPDVFPWVCARFNELVKLSDRKARVAVSATNVRTRGVPMLLPHRVSMTLLVGYPEPDALSAVEASIRRILGKRELHWELEPVSNRPPMVRRQANLQLMQRLADSAGHWEIPLEGDSSVLPSVAGLVPQGVPVVCGLGPAAAELYTPREAVQRISLVQRTLILTQYLREV